MKLILQAIKALFRGLGIKLKQFEQRMSNFDEKMDSIARMCAPDAVLYNDRSINTLEVVSGSLEVVCEKVQNGLFPVVVVTGEYDLYADGVTCVTAFTYTDKMGTPAIFFNFLEPYGTTDNYYYVEASFQGDPLTFAYLKRTRIATTQ